MQTSCLIEILFSTFPNEYIVCKIATFILCAFKKSKLLSVFFLFPLRMMTSRPLEMMQICWIGLMLMRNWKLCKRFRIVFGFCDTFANPSNNYRKVSYFEFSHSEHRKLYLVSYFQCLVGK